MAILFILQTGLRLSLNYLSQKKWDSITKTYNSTQIERLGSVSKDLLESSGEQNKSKVYENTYNFLLANDDLIDSAEGNVLINLLDEIDDTSDVSGYVDSIIINADDRRYGEIIKNIVKLKVKNKSLGYDISKAIYDIEIKGYNSNNENSIMAGFDLLEKNKNNKKFKSIIDRLKNTLNHDESISVISRKKKKSRGDIIKFFNDMEKR